MIRNVTFILLLFFACSAFAQESAPVITLEPVEVSADKYKQPGKEITKEEMEKTGVQDLYQALGRVPGVNLTEGDARGDSSFSIRGFDSQYIPVVVDGISVTSPFNGRGDSASLLMGDMERVIVQKGYSSMLMGANGIGGSVLLTTAKPQKSFEAYLKNAFDFDSEFDKSAYNLTASAGTRLDTFYLKGTLQYRDVSHTRLPDSYIPLQGSVQESGRRLFSDRDDLKATVIAGITPTSELDIWATYVYQNSDRGMNPPNVSALYSLWGWDYWKHQSISLHGEYNASSLKLGFLAFYDTYNNSLSQYATFLHIEYGNPNRITEYDEYAFGGRISADYTINQQHILRAALTFRQDDHWSFRNDLPKRDDIHVREDKISLGTEYEYRPTNKLRFVISGGFDSLLPQAFWSRANAFAEYMDQPQYKVDKQDRWLLAAQAGVFYEFIENHEVRLTYARRNQFPTMNDRYSTRLNESMPNPNLRPEIADHFELGYNAVFASRLLVDTAVFYSRISDKMVKIKVPDPSNSSHPVDFPINMDATYFYGVELSSTWFAASFFEMGVNLSLSDYAIDNSIADAKVVEYHPKLTFNGYIEIRPWKDYISIMPVVEYQSERWADIFETASLDSFTLLHIYLAFNINENVRIDMSVRNLTDELYEFRQNFPQPGRTYTLGLTARI